MGIFCCSSSKIDKKHLCRRKNNAISSNKLLLNNVGSTRDVWIFYSYLVNIVKDWTLKPSPNQAAKGKDLSTLRKSVPLQLKFKSHASAQTEDSYIMPTTKQTLWRSSMHLREVWSPHCVPGHSKPLILKNSTWSLVLILAERLPSSLRESIIICKG